MNAKINTVNIKFDINPTEWLANQRVQELLPRKHTLPYMNLLCEAQRLNATTGSEYVNGEFPLTSTLKSARNLTQKDVDAMVEADLVVQVEGDRWAVVFPNAQTPHEVLQAAANRRAQGAETRKAKQAERKQAVQEDAERQACERELGARRQEEYRARQESQHEELVAVGGPSSGDDEPPF